MDGRGGVEGGAIVFEEGDRSDVPWSRVTETPIDAGVGITVGHGTGGLDVTGHSGGGPASFIAVHRSRGRTAAAFARGADQTTVEQSCLAMLM